MRFQDVPVDPAETEQQVREVMSRPEFAYDKSLLERIGEWITDQLDRLLGPLQPSGPSGAFAGGAGSLVAWIVIGVAALAVVAAVVFVVLRRVRRNDEDDEPVLATEVEHRNPASHWAQEAERHEAAGRWKEALRARYRELVRTLVDRRQVPDVPGLTTGELRSELSRTTPGAAEDFDRASRLFELAWYADRPTGGEENRSMRELSRSVLDRPVEHPSGGSARVEVPA